MADVGEELAKLGLVIEGGNARREVKLTIEELKALANGGREAGDVLMKIGDPATQQGIKNTNETIKRTTDELRRMADAQAAAIRRADPFQAGGNSARLGSPFSGFGGFDRSTATSTAASIRVVNDASQTATFNVSKLRQGVTALAVAATGVPGPLGQMASSLAPLALGGGLTVAVVAGVAAITYGWKEFNKEGREAAALMDSLRAGETSMSLGAMRARQTAIGQEIDALELKRGASGQRLPPELVTDPRTGRQRWEDRWAPQFTGEDQARRDALAQRYAALNTEIRRNAGQEAIAAGKRPDHRWDADNWRLQDDPFRGAPWRRGSTLEGMSLALGLPPSSGQGSDAGIPDVLSDVTASIERFKQREFEATMRAAEALDRLDAQARQAGMQLAQFALNTVASRFAPTSGASVIAQAGAGALSGFGSGGMWGALAGGVIGLAGGLFGLSDAAKQHKHAMDQQRRAIEQERDLRASLNRELDHQLRNAPVGFYVERYYRPTGNGDPRGGIGPLDPRGGRPLGLVSGAAGSGGPVVIDLRGATFSLAGNGGAEVLRDFVRQLRALANAMGGPGMSLADALEMV